MPHNAPFLPPSFEAGAPADPRDIDRAELELAVSFPPDYRKSLEEGDGGEGPVGPAGYLILWSATELVEANRGYKTDAGYADGLALIGTDGGNEAYAIRAHEGTFVAFPLIGYAPEQVRDLGPNFGTFLGALGQPEL